MTLVQALKALQEAGRLRSWALPGMLWRGDGWFESATVIDFDTGPCRWEYRGVLYDDSEHPDWDWNEPGPVLTAPGTVGCLLALLREAADDPKPAITGPSHPQAWGVLRDRGDGYEDAALGDTEGEAVAAALIELAEDLPS